MLWKPSAGPDDFVVDGASLEFGVVDDLLAEDRGPWRQGELERREERRGIRREEQRAVIFGELRRRDKRDGIVARGHQDGMTAAHDREHRIERRRPFGRVEGCRIKPSGGVEKRVHGTHRYQMRADQYRSAI